MYSEEQQIPDKPTSRIQQTDRALTKSEISIVNKIQPKLNKINKYLDDYKKIKESERPQIPTQSYLQNDTLSLMKS